VFLMSEVPLHHIPHGGAEGWCDWQGLSRCRANMAHIDCLIQDSQGHIQDSQGQNPSRPDSSLDSQVKFLDRLREGYRESRRCSRVTYPESYITKYTSIRR